MTNEPPQDDPQQAPPPPPTTPPTGPSVGGQFGGPGAPSATPPGYGAPPPAEPPPAGPPPGYGGPPPGYGAPPPAGPPPGYGTPPPGYGAPPPAGPPPGYGPPPSGPPPGYGSPPPGYGTPPSGPPAGYGAPGSAGYGAGPAVPPPGYGATAPSGDPRWSAPTSGGGAYSSPGPGINVSSVNPLDWAIMGAGLLALIFSFFSYYTASVRVGGVTISDSESAWHGFFGWFAALLAFLAAAVLALAVLRPQVGLPFPHRLVTLGGFALATVSVLLALVVFPHSVPSGSGIDTGRGVGYWLSLIVIVVGLVLCVLRLRATGSRLPWDKSGSSSTTPPSA
jgi:hypothetical protein